MNTRVIINPRRLRGEPLLPRTAVLGLTKQDLDLMLDLAGETEPARVRDFFKVSLAGDKAYSLTGPALGAPQAVMIAEKLFALGVERLIFLGWAGSLRPELNIGDIVLAEGAFSEEGTSVHYPLEEEPRPDPDTIRLLGKSARSMGLDLKSGRIWTTDAIYRETREKVEDFRKQGVCAVEMETSALYTVAAFRKKAAAGVLVISDELCTGKWRPGFDSETFDRARKTAAQLVLRAAQERG